MSCPGAGHCPGCRDCMGSGIVLVIVAVLAALAALEWLLARIWLVLGGSAVVAVGICWAAWRLLRWADRRSEQRGAELYTGRLAPRRIMAPQAIVITYEARPAIEPARIRPPVLEEDERPAAEGSASQHRSLP